MKLTASHRTTYAALFQHPVARNLDWRDVRSLLNVLGAVVPQPNGNLKVTRNGQTTVLRPSRDKHVADVEELMQIRHFLERSGAVAEEHVASGEHLLVVINHHEARVYETELRDSVPERIVPYEIGGTGRYLRQVEDGNASGQRKPEQRGFYEAVATSLHGAQKILLFGSGTGSSSAMDHLLAELSRNHPDLAERVVGSVIVDETHLTDNQLLAKARECYSVVAQQVFDDRKDVPC
jgi:hypothetical protein